MVWDQLGGENLIKKRRGTSSTRLFERSDRLVVELELKGLQASLEVEDSYILWDHGEMVAMRARKGEMGGKEGREGARGAEEEGLLLVLLCC